MRGLAGSVLVINLLALNPVTAWGQWEGYEIVVFSSSANNAGIAANCPEGKTTIGGGYHFAYNSVVRSSHPVRHDSGRHGWVVIVDPAAAPYGAKTVYAICVNAVQSGGVTPPPAENLKLWLENGNTLCAVVDQATSNLGSLQQGGPSAVTYSAGDFTPPGPSVPAGETMTGTYSTANLQSYGISIWGRVFKFDNEGELWDIHGGNAADPSQVGYVHK